MPTVKIHFPHVSEPQTSRYMGKSSPLESMMGPLQVHMPYWIQAYFPKALLTEKSSSE